MAWALAALACAANAVASLGYFGGWSELTGPWPIPWHDHPMHLHNAWVASSFLGQNGTTAGYDPFFMAGYPKSIVSDPSGTAVETFVWLFGGGGRTVVAYKLFVFLACASLTGWVVLAVRAWGGDGSAAAAAAWLFNLYLWTDFPPSYAALGMVSFLLMVPIAQVALALVGRYLERGGWGWWGAGTVAASSMLWVHPLCVLTVVPAIGLAFGIDTLMAAFEVGGQSHGRRFRRPLLPALGLLATAVVGLVLNAYWWLPALTLRSTQLSRGLGFVHPEGVGTRLLQIVGLARPVQPPIQWVLLAASLASLIALRRTGPVRLAMLVGLMAAGFGFGYLGGWSRALDPIEPGRQTYVLYTTACVLVGLGWGRWREALGRRWPRLATAAFLAPSLLLGAWMAPRVLATLERRVGLTLISTAPPGMTREPFLSSRPHPRLTWIVGALKREFEPGERIYYEEGGRTVQGELVDLFGGYRFGGLLPYLTGLEVIGGPFLNVPVRNNFTQVGMGRHFGSSRWSVAEFERYARIYRPAGIVCWSPAARSFCRANGSTFEVVKEDSLFLIARVRGFEGDAIRGRAEVEAEAGRLTVRMTAPDVDGTVLLRYHTAPGLVGRSGLEPGSERREADPVPFIRLPFTREPVTLDLDPLPWEHRGRESGD